MIDSDRRSGHEAARRGVRNPENARGSKLRRVATFTAAAWIGVMSIAVARPARAVTLDARAVEWQRVNISLAWGLGGAVMAYYCQRMDYGWFHHIVPKRFSASEAAFLLGGWLAFLTYTGTGAALLRTGTAQVPNSPGVPPMAWPEIGVDGDGRAFAGAGFRF